MPIKKIDPLEGTRALKRLYPDAHCALDYTNAFELLIATILSAQCTDERVNLATPALFEAWPRPEDLAKASLTALENTLSSVNFYRNKAKNLIGMAQMLMDKFAGKVPQTLEELVLLPGVGRKTANVVLGNAFNITSGIVVDTHVARLSYRMGWTKSDDPVQIEKDLMKKIPREDWIMISHLLISHGRTICKARNPDCKNCALSETCPKKGVTASKVRSNI
jgi:endonuclease III